MWGVPFDLDPSSRRQQRWAAELLTYCQAFGVTPAEALRDPDLAFNVTVMRMAHVRRSQEAQQVADSASDEGMGLDVIVSLLAALNVRG